MTRIPASEQPICALDTHVNPPQITASSRSGDAVADDVHRYQPQTLRVPDRLNDLQLLRDLEIIDARTMRELGPLPVGGLPIQPRRKPRLQHPAVSQQTTALSPSDEDTTMQWKSAAAVAVLTTGSALAACGTDDAAAPADPPALAVPATPAPVSLPTGAAVPPAAQTTEVVPTNSAEGMTTEPVRGPAIPAAQLRQQILALLGSLQSLEDLERGNVERTFDIRAKRASDMREGYEYDGITSEGWSYGILNAKLGRLDEPSTIIIGLHHGVEPWTDQQPTYCTLEFEPLAKELVAMGYEQGTRAHNRGGDMTWGFGRDSATEKVGFGVGVIVYTLDSDSGKSRTCVGGLRIGGGPLDG